MGILLWLTFLSNALPQCVFHCGTCSEGAQYLDRFDSRERQLRSHIVGNRGEAKDTDLLATASSAQVLQLLTRVVLKAQHNRLAFHSPLYGRTMSGQLG